jgi:hypothetical protein
MSTIPDSTPVGSTLASTTHAVLLRPLNARLRSLLALACAAIISTSITLALLATSGNGGRGVPSATLRGPAATETGARLDHRGLHDSAYLSGLAETGARLDHRGLNPAEH